MIQDWMPTLVAHIGEISGLKASYGYDDLPGSLTIFPCAVTLPERGPFAMWDTGAKAATHDVRVTVYVASQILPQAYAVAIPLIGAMRNKLASKITLNGLVTHVIPRSPFYEGPGEIRYGIAATGSDKIYLGVLFNLEVKENETFTVAA